MPYVICTYADGATERFNVGSARAAQESAAELRKLAPKVTGAEAFYDDGERIPTYAESGQFPPERD